MFFPDLPIKYSRYPFMYFDTARGPVKVVHPQNFSGDPVTLAQQLYSVTPEKSHYIVAHCHREQFGWSPDGRFEMLTLGTGRDPMRTKYKATAINKHKQWDASFIMIRDGFIIPMSLKRTDWKRELGFWDTGTVIRITVIRYVKSYPNTPSYRLSFDFWRYTRTSWSTASGMGCCGRLRQTMSSPNRSTAAWS